MASRLHRPGIGPTGCDMTVAQLDLAQQLATEALPIGQIVQNEWYGYPQEWFPSVSATIGDKYPERSVFMLLIAITSVLTTQLRIGPRFALVGLWYLLTRRNGQALPKFVAITGVVRTLTCGGWTYITSTDDHDWHDILMISYIVATIPWTAGCIALSPPNAKAIKYRKYLCSAFFGTLVPLIYFFIQHKVHRVAGAYTIYAFFEWSLILFDVGFDAVTALDFDSFELIIKDVHGASQGTNVSPQKAAVLEKEKEKATAGLMHQKVTPSGMLDIAADVYHGFVFWSILTSLGVTIWYFPLWYMGISGYEALVMVSISPLLLGISPFRWLITRFQRFFHLLSLTGLVAFLIKDPIQRLYAVGFGLGMQCLAWVATLHSESVHEGRLELRILSWAVGLILSSTVKFACRTLNPIWPIMRAETGGWNYTGLFLGLIAAWRFTRRGPLNLDGVQIKSGSSFLAACSIGGLFFALHSLLSDTSTMILWVWDGYPIRGPTSNTTAFYTIFAMTAGVLIGAYKPGLASLWTSYFIGCVGAGMVTIYPHWKGYYGALALTTYLMAVAVPLLRDAAKRSPGLVFGLGFFIYNFMVLFHVWVVAYAFVPGGPLVREHTDWVMASMMVLIGCGVFNLNAGKAAKKSKGKNEAQTSRSTLQHRKHYITVLGAINVAFLVAAYLRFPTNDYKPYHAPDRVITAGMWTIHFGLDNDMWSSERRMRDLLRDAELDVIGLVESDQQRIIMGNRDSTQYLAEDLGMYVDYGPGPNKHTWGAALLSKFPIINSTHHLLPSPVGELAPAIHATLDVYGTMVDVFVFHSGQEEDPEDRRLQSEYMRELMGSTNRPSVLLSYLVTRPLEGNYNTYVSEQSGMHDVDPTDWDRWCEYILFKGLKRVGYARISRSTITDTELQVGKFVVPEPGSAEATRAWEVDAEARNSRVEESQVPEGLRFPAVFRGEGVRGHRYHVFDEPRYFNY
ncbi:calcofluor white hypersensitive protein [Pyricularia oryzae Y34]|uniref:Calcofluor white hypersensitive protein n=1 Tax=Pyricularia oryzae (strain Y34) TaxID=1143189 RepID=A0AA97NRT6_PYRO3|nr:calcofluor white hypersensitive protein [Pyricularia oryzae Y34]